MTVQRAVFAKHSGHHINTDGAGLKIGSAYAHPMIAGDFDTRIAGSNTEKLMCRHYRRSPIRPA
jgi:hypothetical protein